MGKQRVPDRAFGPCTLRMGNGAWTPNITFPPPKSTHFCKRRPFFGYLSCGFFTECAGTGWGFDVVFFFSIKNPRLRAFPMAVGSTQRKKIRVVA